MRIARKSQAYSATYVCPADHINTSHVCLDGSGVIKDLCGDVDVERVGDEGKAAVYCAVLATKANKVVEV
jgi:hypothetical protein